MIVKIMLASVLSLASVFATDELNDSDDPSYYIPKRMKQIYKPKKQGKPVHINKNREIYLNHPDCKHCYRSRPGEKPNLESGEKPHGKILQPRGHIFSLNQIGSEIDFQVKGSKNNCFIGFYDKQQKINFLGKVPSLENEKVKKFIEENQQNLSVYLLSTKYGGRDLSQAIRFFLLENNFKTLQLKVCNFIGSSPYIVMGPNGLEQVLNDPLKD